MESLTSSSSSAQAMKTYRPPGPDSGPDPKGKEPETFKKGKKNLALSQLGIL